MLVLLSVLPMPMSPRCISCAVCVWSAPPGRFDLFAGYNVRYTSTESSNEMVENVEGATLYHIPSQDLFQTLGSLGSIQVQVSANHSFALGPLIPVY